MELFLSCIITNFDGEIQTFNTAPVPELTNGHDLLPVHSTFCLTDCILVFCFNVTVLPQSSKEGFPPKLSLHVSPFEICIQCTVTFVI